MTILTPQFAVSSWSLHRALGLTHANGPGTAEPWQTENTFGAPAFSLHELPRELAKHGYFRAELCHFHIASFDPEYLASLKSAFAAAGVTIQTLLIDDGDLSDPARDMRDLEWIKSWIKAAGLLGAENARVIAGKQPPSPATLDLAVSGLRQCAAAGREAAVRIVTENWFDLLATPKEVNHVLDALDGEVGFLADTGNWRGPTKYADLQAIFARAEFCHAKAYFVADPSGGLAIEGRDFGACMDAAIRANYRGPFTLIFDSDGDEWAGLEAERQFITGHFARITPLG
jgi:sugar phosphate isomerase/epimerase